MPRKKGPEKYRSGRELVEIKRTVGGKRQSFYGKTKAEAEKSYEQARMNILQNKRCLSTELSRTPILHLRHGQKSGWKFTNMAV